MHKNAFAAGTWTALAVLTALSAPPNPLAGLMDSRFAVESNTFLEKSGYAGLLTARRHRHHHRHLFTKIQVHKTHRACKIACAS